MYSSSYAPHTMQSEERVLARTIGIHVIQRLRKISCFFLGRIQVTPMNARWRQKAQWRKLRHPGSSTAST